MRFLHLHALAAVSLGGVCGAQSLAYDWGYGGDAARFGWCVADVPDIDGDGHPDVLIGAPFEDWGGNADAGAVHAFSGRTGTSIVHWFGENAGDLFGWSVDGLEDLNGDGRGDVIVGAPLYDWSGSINAGKVYVFSGATGAQNLAIYQLQSGGQLGTTVRGLGDIDGDGSGDFAVGSPYMDDPFGGHVDAGRVDVWSGGAMTKLGHSVGISSGDLFGYDLDVAVRGTTPASTLLIVGAPGTGLAGAAVLMTATGNLGSSVTGGYVDGWFGGSVAGLGDADGDGKWDVAVSEAYADMAGADSGRVVVYEITGQIMQVLKQLPGTVGGERFGEELAGIGDYDGDGLDDLFVGMPVADDGGTNSGKAAVLSVMSGNQLQAWIGAPGKNLGRGLSSAGDLNLDGAPDLIVGAPLPTTGVGHAYAYLAKAPLPTVYCTAKVNSQGCTPTIGYGGVASVSIAEGFHVKAQNVLNQKNGIVFWGRMAAALAFQDATLCVKPPLERSPVLLSGGSSSGTDCTGQYSFYFTHSYMQSEAILAGDTIYAQVWSRDPGFAPPFNFGMTDALSFDVVP